jgi:hypothetical protein
MADNTYTDLRDDPTPEKTTRKLTFTISGNEGEDLALTTLTVTLYNDRNNAIINERDGVSILNENGGSVSGSGETLSGEWKMEELDNVIVQSGVAAENHTAEFEWTYNDGNDTGRHRVYIKVKNFVKTT